jgi:uncharacterized protein (TIGR02453 family)
MNPTAWAWPFAAALFFTIEAAFGWNLSRGKAQNSCLRCRGAKGLNTDNGEDPMPATTDTKPSAARFTGIDEAALTFLRGLKQNNDRDWFRERKPVYEEKLKRPVEALVTEAAEAARKRGFPLFPKTKNPLTRIYRDIRFSHDKTPFHTHVGAVLHGPPRMGGYGEIYIHIEPANPFVAAGFWMPERDFLRRWRERMAAKPGEFQKVVRELTAKRLEWLDGYSLKRMPRGFERQADGDLESFFKRQIFIVRRKFTLRDIGSRSLVEKVAEFAVSARPLLEYGWSINYRPKRDILDGE